MDIKTWLINQAKGNGASNSPINKAISTAQNLYKILTDDKGWVRQGKLAPIKQVGSYIPGGWEGAKQRLSQTSWQEYTPLSMGPTAVQSSKMLGTAIGKPQLGEDIGYALKGATALTPWGMASKYLNKQQEALVAPTTSRQQNAYKLGKTAYGTLLTAPIGGANIVKNIGSRVVQGALLGTGMKVGSNLLSGDKWNTNLKQGTIEGIENSWQLAFTNLISDKLGGISKLTKGSTTNSLDLTGKIIKQTSKMGLDTKPFLIKYTKDLFIRTMMETGVENTWFSALSEDDKNTFVQRWWNNLPGTFLGNLVFNSVKLGKGGLDARSPFKKVEYEKQAREAFKQTINEFKIDGDTQPKLIEASNMESGYLPEDNIVKLKLKPETKVKPTSQKIVDFIFGDDKLFKAKRGVGSVTQDPTFDNPLLVQAEIMKKLERAKAKNKVNIIDYFRTPDRVMKKIGLENESKLLRTGYDNYKKDLKVELNKVTEWAKKASDTGSSERIFRALDGEKIKLEGNELIVAKEIRDYLRTWADKLDLPYESRITKYIPHIFEKGEITTEFDPEIAKMIESKVPGSVYNPFMQKRAGVKNYVVDTWRALDAYIKRATRKANIDPALDKISQASDKLDLESFNYVKRYIDKVNLRPTETENLIDNGVKTIFGTKYTSRPTAYLTGKLRTMVSRALLGMNPGSAVRNLSQGSNTYSVLGEKYTIKGYLELLKKGNVDDLYKDGILDDAIADRNISAVKLKWQKLDGVLFKLFDWTEKVNRGSAYYGARAKALDLGLTEEKATEFAKKVIRDTQFTFGNIDTPVGINSNLMKTATQFMSYGIKQAEFLGEKIKAKDIVGLMRFTGAQLLYITTVGKLIGMDWKDIIPITRFEPPAIKLAGNIKNVISPNQYTSRGEALVDTATMVIPGGSQAKKTIQGLGTVNRGYSKTPSGNVRFRVEKSIPNYVRGGLFGQWNLPEGQEYFKTDGSPMGKTQSKIVKKYISQYNSLVSKGYDKKQVYEYITFKQNKELLGDYGKKYELLVKKGHDQTKVFEYLMNKKELDEALKEVETVTKSKAYDKAEKAKKLEALKKKIKELKKLLKIKNDK
jgi:hypothetical protein